MLENSRILLNFIDQILAFLEICFFFQVGQVDVLTDCDESAQLGSVLSPMFESPAEWDKEHDFRYKGSSCSCHTFVSGIASCFFLIMFHFTRCDWCRGSEPFFLLIYIVIHRPPIIDRSVYVR